MQLWIYRGAGNYSTCKYRMGTEVDVVLVEDQGMYMIGETWMLPVESIGVCTDE